MEDGISKFMMPRSAGDDNCVRQRACPASLLPIAPMATGSQVQPVHQTILYKPAQDLSPAEAALLASIQKPPHVSICLTTRICTCQAAREVDNR